MTPVDINDYRNGWVDGSRFDPFKLIKMKNTEAYARGYKDGRNAFKEAMKRERERELQNA